MSDDLLSGDVGVDTDFDPNAVSSDDFLDDPAEDNLDLEGDLTEDAEDESLDDE